MLGGDPRNDTGVYKSGVYIEQLTTHFDFPGEEMGVISQRREEEVDMTLLTPSTLPAIEASKKIEHENFLRVFRGIYFP